MGREAVTPGTGAPPYWDTRHAATRADFLSLRVQVDRLPPARSLWAGTVCLLLALPSPAYASGAGAMAMIQYALVGWGLLIVGYIGLAALLLARSDLPMFGAFLGVSILGIYISNHVAPLGAFIALAPIPWALYRKKRTDIVGPSAAIIAVVALTSVWSKTSVIAGLAIILAPMLALPLALACADKHRTALLSLVVLVTVGILLPQLMLQGLQSGNLLGLLGASSIAGALVGLGAGRHGGYRLGAIAFLGSTIALFGMSWLVLR